MRRFFLGKPLHWALMIGLVALGWSAGLGRLHVIHFNLFVLALLALSVALLGIVLATTGPGDQVTRDPIRAPEED